MAGHALAERDVHAAGAVDHDPQALGRHAVAREHLDVRLDVRQPRLDLGLYVSVALVAHSVLLRKRWAAKPTSRCGRSRRSESPCEVSIGANQSSTTSVTGPSLTSSTDIRAPNLPALRAERVAHPLVQRLGLLGRRGVHEARAVALARVAVEGELAHAQDLAAGVRHRAVHLAVLVLEDPQREQLAREPVGVLGAVAAAHAEQHEQAGPISATRSPSTLTEAASPAEPRRARRAPYPHGDGRGGRDRRLRRSPADGQAAGTRRVGPDGGRGRRGGLAARRGAADRRGPAARPGVRARRRRADQPVELPPLEPRHADDPLRVHARGRHLGARRPAGRGGGRAHGGPAARPRGRGRGGRAAGAGGAAGFRSRRLGGWDAAR